MKKIIFTVAILFSININAQVGIGTTSPDTSTILDIVSADKGILIPRVSLTGKSDAVTIENPTTSLLIYNSATVSGMTPGFYYWKDNTWNALSLPSKPLITSSTSADPVTVYTVNGYLKVGNTADNPADSSFSPEEGTMRFKSDTSKFQVFDGTVWVDLH